jgi:hypothetical protein
MMRVHSSAVYCWSLALSARHADIESAEHVPASAPAITATAAQHAGAFWHALQLSAPPSPNKVEPLMPVVPVVDPVTLPVDPTPLAPVVPVVVPVVEPEVLPVAPTPVTPVVLPVELPVLPLAPLELQPAEAPAWMMQSSKALQAPAMHVFKEEENAL